jgi:HTH-type transcriptional regulator/antitoxin MqsA
MKCPVCGGAELIHDTRDLTYTYKGHTTTVPNITGDFCPACGESVLERESGDEYAFAIRDFQAEVNASYVDPAFITRVRRKLRIDQREAAQLFGGGINAFSRYENGRAKPPASLVKLLKLLDKKPELMKDLRDIDAA